MKFICLFIACFCQMGAFAEDHWDGKEYAENSEPQKRSAESFLAKFAFQGTEKILDVGCGDGKITAKMAELLPKGKVVGIDISASMIEHSRNSFQHVQNLSFVVQDALALIAKNEYDLVTSFTTLQWIVKQKEALIGFEKALKPGGRLWVQIPLRLPPPMQQAIEEITAKDQWKSFFFTFSPPWRFYKPSEYRELLTEAKFIPLGMVVEIKNEAFPSRDAFQSFLRQWFPYLRPLPAERKEGFLTELVDRYLELCPKDAGGSVYFTVERLEVEAQKRL